MATRTKNPYEATHRAEVVFRRDLSARYGLNEVETDYEIVFFNGVPNEAQLLSIVPEGWDFVESHVAEIDEFDLDEDDADLDHPAFADDHYFDDDFDLDIEELELEAV